MPADPCPVLIIGAGPSGLFTACELARHGVRARLTERTLTPHQQARGTAIQPASLELLARAGVVEPFLQEATQIREVRLVGPGLTPLAESRIDGTDATWPFQCSLPQWRTEALLTDQLARLGGRVERGVELVAVQPHPDGALVQLRHHHGGEESLAVRWLIDASGAHSLTRHAMEESLEGETYPQPCLVLDAALTLPIAPATISVLLVAEAGPVLLTPLPGGRRLLFIQLGGSDDPAAGPAAGEEGAPEGALTTPPSLAAIEELVIGRLGIDPGLHDVRWISRFRLHRRIVPELTDGHRFLIGDAGHLSSPLGGEGLNSGLMDGADLAWKLALVMGGMARPELLKSYGIERGMADRQVLAVSDQQHHAVLSLWQSLGQPQTTTPPPISEVEAAMGRRTRSMLDVSYAGSPLIGAWGEPGLPPPAPQPGERWPQRCRLMGVHHHLLWFAPTESNRHDSALAAFARRWQALVEVHDANTMGLDPTQAGVPTGGAVLIRPDGFIAYRALPACDEALAAIDAHLERWFQPATSP